MFKMLDMWTYLISNIKCEHTKNYLLENIYVTEMLYYASSETLVIRMEAKHPLAESILISLRHDIEHSFSDLLGTRAVITIIQWQPT